MSGLAVEGRRSRRPGFVVLAASTGLGLAMGAISWIARPPGPSLLEALGVFFPICGVVIGIVAAQLVFRHIVARIGRVTFEGEAIVFSREGHAALLMADDVAGYLDGERDIIELVARRSTPVPRGFHRLTIPTPTEAERSAVLRELERLGVTRLTDRWTLPPVVDGPAEDGASASPRLTVTGTPEWSSGQGVFAAWIAAAVIGLAVAGSGGSPWLDFVSPIQLMVYVVLGAAGAGAISASLVVRRSKARAGQVVFHERWIVFARGGVSTTVSFDELASYRDGEADFVEVVRRPGGTPALGFGRLTVPTPTEEDRVRVLAVLDAKGLTRLGRQ